MLVSKDGDNGGLTIKTLFMEHYYFRQREIPSLRQSYLANYFKDNIYKNPKFTTKDMQNEVRKHLKLKVSHYKCIRAKHIVITELKGSFKQEFADLPAYIQVVKTSNPGTLCEVQLSEEGRENGIRVFKRIFVMFEACRRNWIEGCRPIISLDGCHLKGVCQGILLTAVMRDGNDGVVPIAWAIVSKENKNNWNWFLCWLRQELNLENGSTITIVSDMQKGITDAVQTTLSNAEHRWCARHIYANWSKKWRGTELKKHFWICAWSTFKEEFKQNLTKLGDIKKDVAEDLMKYPVQTWCRAYQSSRSCTYMVDNNISESFNATLLDARHKPIISMLEDVRTIVMARIIDRMRLCAAWIGEWSPACMKLFQEAKLASIGCKVLWNGAEGFEIGDGEDKHTVYIDKKLCTCRIRELTGITCRKFYKTEKLKPIQPPPVEAQAGRPRKKRIRALNEPSSSNHLSRKGQEPTATQATGDGSHVTREASQETINATQASLTTEQSSQGRRQSKRPSKGLNGIGVHVNTTTGQTTINSGMNSERIIVPPQEVISHEVDPNVRFPIPNKREIRKSTRTRHQIQFNSMEKALKLECQLNCHSKLWD
ncbi:uncharacterized protein LOC131008039 [Salvia miltiorrhiza]|uniref:uncharacterized protein LOC131008039 n=1 Tax=Salvia miltiorrhiza TaxID=226208 RepID=UPI0025AB9A2B|nr:uncharacterized protein LOC131008039 [Salvia miltiorrhiza]